MKTTKILMLAVLTSVLASCGKDFLETSPIVSTVETQYYKNDSDMYKGLIGAYDPLAYNYNAANYVTIGEIRSDNANTGAGNDEDQDYLQDWEAFCVDENTNLTSLYFWKFHYIGIYRANQVINAEYTSDVAEVYKAEAKVLRAWYHFELMRLYGPCVVSTRNDYENEYAFVRNTREEVNAQIEKDLLEAIPNLSASLDNTQTGRIKKSTAQAILAKHYMYAADWDNDNKETFKKAIPLLEAVIASGDYQLTDYTKLFGWGNKNSAESIFEVQTTNTHGAMNGTTPYYIYNNEGTYWINWINPRWLKNHYKYANNCWGCWLPTKSLYDYFLEDDHVRRDESLLTVAELNGVVDPENPKKVSNYDVTRQNPNDWEGYDKKKYVALVDEVPTSGNKYHNWAANVILIRYSDIYLLLAEAQLRGNGDEAAAKKYIKDLRDVHVPGGLSVEEMMTQYPDRFPTLLDVIWYERRCEFACEGDRWFDLVRSGRAKDVMTNHTANERLHPFTLTWDNTMNYLPIHATETTNCPTLTTYPDEAYQ